MLDAYCGKGAVSKLTNSTLFKDLNLPALHKIENF